MRYLIFDFDGTLAWLRVDWGAVRASIEEIYGPLRGKPLFTWLRERVLRGLDISRALEIIREAELEAVEALDFDEEIVALLRLLRGRGLRMALISMQDDEVLRRALEVMGAEGIFDFVVGRRTELLREEQIRRVLKGWGIGPGQAIFISDRPEDVELGLGMGLRALRLFYLDGSLKRWLREFLDEAINV